MTIPMTVAGNIRHHYPAVRTATALPRHPRTDASPHRRHAHGAASFEEHRGPHGTAEVGVRANAEGGTPPVSEQAHRVLRSRRDRGLIELLVSAITNAHRQTPVRAKRSAS